MVAVVLAGGIGSRLQPLTNGIPKPLMPIGGKPVIELLLLRLKQCGVTTVYLAVHHLADQLKTQLGNGERFGLTIHCSKETHPLSTVGPLSLIADLPENFLVVNGDIITDLDFRSVYDTHIQKSAQLTVVTCKRSHKMDYGVFDIDTQGRVTGFTEKPELSFVVSAGIYVFNRSLLAHIPKNQRYGFDDLVVNCLNKQIPIHTYPYDGYWLDIGRPDDYEQAQRDSEKRRD